VATNAAAVQPEPEVEQDDEAAAPGPDASMIHK
jgi:hypothetical protein